MSQVGIDFRQGFGYTASDVEKAINKLSEEDKEKVMIALKKEFIASRMKTVHEDLARGLYTILSGIGAPTCWQILTRTLIEKEVKDGAAVQPVGG